MNRCLIALFLFVGSFAQAQTTAKLMLFGGQDHDVYLGCLNCSKFAPDSLFNAFGEHGNKFSSTSIFNSFSPYGSRFSDQSPCNKFAAHPPVIVDGSGNVYGFLTSNNFNPKQVKHPALRRLIEAVCSGE